MVDLEFGSMVKEGLTANPKNLSSKYFYDEEGSKIFQKIMKMPGYYLTELEHSILLNHKDEIINALGSSEFDLVELGSGDGYKSKVLVKGLFDRKIDFTYIPIDISNNAMISLERELNDDIPDLNFNPLIHDYFAGLDVINKNSKHRKVILFLGSNIGNFGVKNALPFLEIIRDYMKKKDLFLIGFDLKKHPKLIDAAYNDPEGITKLFNLNLLTRINKEFEGNFDLENFDHHITYNPENGEAKSYLISNKKHQVEIKLLKLKLNFEYAEPIFMEISQKYDEDIIEKMANKTGFKLIKNYTDENNFFIDSLWEAV